MRPEILEGQGDILLLCDHASNAVPPEMDLGIAAHLLDKHIAIDIGAGDLTRALAMRLGAPAVLATVSRLVIDLNRDPDHPGLLPASSDGHVIPGNAAANRADRLVRFHVPYHDALAAEIAAHDSRLIVAIHSFTPRLETDAADRPWEAGVLYNQDTRAAYLVLGLLRAAGVSTGDNQPYSGRLFNATLDRHGEARGISSVSIEIRNDQISDPAGIARWAEILAPILVETCNGLAQAAPATT